MRNVTAEGASRHGQARKRVAAVGWGRGLGILVRIIRLNLRHPVLVLVAVVSTFVAAGLQLLVPRLLGAAVDQAQGIATSGGEAAGQALWGTAAALLAVSVARGVFTLVQNYSGEAVGHHAAYELRLAYYDKLQRLSFSFHDRMHSGDLITLGILDIDGVRMFFSTGLVRAVLLAVLIGAGAFMLLSTDLVLGLLALSFVPFVGWRSSVTQLRLRATWLELQEKLTTLSRVMEENMQGIRVVRAFAARLHELAKFDGASKAALALAHRRVGLRVNNTSAMNFSFFAAMGLVLAYGGHQVLAGAISVGTLASFLTFMTILQMPVRQLGLMVNSFARASTCGARLFEVLDLDAEVRNAENAGDLAVGEGRLRFESVSFRYPGTARDALDGVSFEARKGQKIGIIGPPGSGKSTIAHLIPRFYDVKSGRITIDGQDISRVTLASLRRAVTVVQQDSFLFTTSIQNNIAYGDPWARERRIERAAASAQLHDYIAGLTETYRTVVGERGVSLSGGQRQRLTIARSLLLTPAVMIFDDSTAAVDAATEQRILEAMRGLARDRITIVISHRLSSLMDADQILFIDDGRIVERGTHHELLASGGRYRELYDLQVQSEPAEAAE